MMKRIMTLCLLLTLFLGGMKAQKGMQGVGANLAFNFRDNGAIGASIKYQYNISNYFRLEPSVSGYLNLGDSGKEDYFFSGLLNGHLFFMCPRAIRPYILFGIGAVGYEYEHYHNYNGYSYGEYMTEFSFGGDMGLGLDWRISHKLSLQAEAGVLFATAHEMWAFKANLGITYNF